MRPSDLAYSAQRGIRKGAFGLSETVAFWASEKVVASVPGLQVVAYPGTQNLLAGCIASAGSSLTYLDVDCRRHRDHNGVSQEWGNKPVQA